MNEPDPEIPAPDAPTVAIARPEPGVQYTLKDGVVTGITLTNPGPPGGTAVWDALKRIEPVWDAAKQEWKAMPNADA